MSDSYTAPDFTAAALITIDVQRDTLDGGPLEIPGTTAALPAMRTLLDAFRQTSRPIVHIVRLYRPDGCNVDPCRRGAVEGGLRVLTPGQDGSQPAVGLLPEAGLTLDADLLLAGGIQQLAPREVAIYKPRWGAFHNTPLDTNLRERDVTTLVFCGCSFPNCPPDFHIRGQRARLPDRVRHRCDIRRLRARRTGARSDRRTADDSRRGNRRSRRDRRETRRRALR